MVATNATSQIHVARSSSGILERQKLKAAASQRRKGRFEADGVLHKKKFSAWTSVLLLSTTLCERKVKT